MHDGRRMKNIIDVLRNGRGTSRALHPGCPPLKPGDSKLVRDQPGPRVRFGPGGGIYHIVTTAKESQGRHFAFVAVEPPGGGPPLHTHATEDEYFHVLEGEITVYVDGQVVVARPGQSVFVPRGAAHCFKNCSTREARVLVLFTPGRIEGFFDYGLPVNGRAPSDEHLIVRLQELGPRYGLALIGPSPL